MLHLLNDGGDDLINAKNYDYVIMASLKSEPMGKLVNRKPCSRLLISGLPGLAWRTHVYSLDREPCLVNLISKYTHLILSTEQTCNTYRSKL